MLEKIKTLGQLKQIASEARANGRKVVLAHGVFDILHVGHKRHLDIGKRHGDILIVTLTTDKFVNKGPDRPVFAEKLRAEMVAGLQSVDYVAISPNPGAEHVIETVKAELLPQGFGIQRRRRRRHRPDQDRTTDGREVRRRGAVHRGHHLQFVQSLQSGAAALSGRRRDISQGPADADHGRRPHQGGCRRPEHALPHRRRYDHRRIRLRRAARKTGQGKHHCDEIPGSRDLLRRRHRDRQSCGPIVRPRRSRDAARTGRQPRGIRPQPVSIRTSSWCRSIARAGGRR